MTRYEWRVKVARAANERLLAQRTANLLSERWTIVQIIGNVYGRYTIVASKRVKVK